MEVKVQNNWIETDLDTILERITNGSSLKQEEDPFKNSFPITRIETIANESIDLKRVKYVLPTEKDKERFSLLKGDILFSHINSDKHLGKTAIYDLDITLIHGINLLLMRPVEQFNSRLLNYLFKYYRFRGKFREVAQRAVNQSSINQKKLKRFPVPLPPFEEQNRIVAKLDKLFEQLEFINVSLEKIPVLLKKLRQQVLTQAVTGKLTEEWRKGKKFDNSFEDHLLRAKNVLIEKKEVRKTSVKPSDIKDNLGSLPQGWKRVSLYDVANIIDPNPSHRMPEYFPEGIPFLSTENITKNGINFKKGKKVGESTLLDQINRYKINDGDFIFTRIGTIGKSTYIPVERKYAFSHAVCIISSYHPKYCNPQYLKFVLSSSKILDQSKEGVQSVGVPDLGMGKVRAFQIPLMDPEEQKEIISRANQLFSKIEFIEERYLMLKVKIKNLPQSILHKAFSGELVPQLESDGDARELLEEIRKLKEESGVKAVNGKRKIKKNESSDVEVS